MIKMLQEHLAISMHSLDSRRRSNGARKGHMLIWGRPGPRMQSPSTRLMRPDARRVFWNWDESFAGLLAWSEAMLSVPCAGFMNLHGSKEEKGCFQISLCSHYERKDSERERVWEFRNPICSTAIQKNHWMTRLHKGLELLAIIHFCWKIALYDEIHFILRNVEGSRK